MKYFITICTWLAIALGAHSQKTIFIRVFDESGKKIHKGFLSQVSDSSLIIRNEEKKLEVPVSKISAIKIKRSFGHTVLISSLIGAAGFSIFGAATAEPDAWFSYSVGEGAAAGFVFGALTGGAVGSIVAAANKKSILNMDQKEWIKAMSALSYYLETSK